MWPIWEKPLELVFVDFVTKFDGDLNTEGNWGKFEWRERIFFSAVKSDISDEDDFQEKNKKKEIAYNQMLAYLMPLIQ